MSEAPKKIGKYEIVGTLGSGAMGTVHKGRDPLLNRFVAIKTISTDLLSESELKQRFLREARAAAQLNHPNIVTVYEFAEDERGVFLAMELLEGDSLQELINKGELGDFEDRLDILEQVCEGLGFAHEAGIVHRDLKPGNIHVSKDGRAKLLDFGLVRLPSSDITKTGHVMGTPNYMSPEQVNGDAVDVRSDVFSVGVICYEMFTGQKPFRADTVPATMFKIVQGKREPLSNFGFIPPPLVGVVDRALSQSADDRPDDATGLLVELQDIREESLRLAADLNFVSQATVISKAPPTKSRPRASRSGGSKARTSSSAQTGSSGRVATGRTNVPPVSGSHPVESTTRRKPPPPQASSNTGLLIGVGVLAAAVLAGGFFWMRSQDSGAEVSALNNELIASQQELVQRSFDQRDYPAVIGQADRLLELDPENALAIELKSKTAQVMADIEVAASEARAAVTSGDMEQAAEVLGRVLDLDPSHPLGAELSETLDQHFVARAQAALDEMAQTKQNASAARSESTYREAERLASQADAEFNRGEYTNAAQHYLSAKGLYAQARQAAAQRAAQSPEPTPVPTPKPTASIPAPAPGPTTDPRAQRAHDQARANFGDTSRRARSEGLSGAALRTADNARSRAESQASSGNLKGATETYQNAARDLESAVRQHVEQKAAASAAAAQPAPPPTPVPAPVGPDDDTLIRRVLQNYEAAIENEDIALYRTVKPNLSAAEQQRLENSFVAVSEHKIDLTIQSIDVNGEQATVSFSRTDAMVAGGQQRSNTSQQVFTLSKQNGTWVIVETGS